MDTLTQGLLGAAVGHAAFSSSLGRRARWWGAVGGLLPDLDVIAVATHGAFGEMLYHRGFTHSLWFGFVAGPLLGWALHAFYRRREREGHGTAGPLLSWMGLFALALFTHPLIDWFTVYGTQLLAPFSRERFALDALGIIDPFYSLPLLFALLYASFAATSARAGRHAVTGALLLSTAYLVYGALLNQRVEDEVHSAFVERGESPDSVRSYPTLLQPWLRRVVVRSGERVHVGWLSSFETKRARWQSFAAQRNELVDRLASTERGRLFEWFAMGETAGRVREGDGGYYVELEDLRYGMPGRPDHGMWGVRAFFDKQGSLRGEVERFSRPRLSSLGLAELWRAAFGDLSALGLPLPPTSRREAPLKASTSHRSASAVGARAPHRG